MTAPARLLPILISLALLAACAGPRPRPERIAYDAEVIEADPRDADLAAKNDEELFAVGTAAASAGDDRRAAAAFGRLADLHPGSRHRAAALRGAGVALAREGRWAPALTRFRALAEGADGAQAIDAAFHVAEAQYRLGALDEAHAALDALAARPDLSDADRVRALGQRGVVELDQGRLDEAERSLEAALVAYEAGAARARLAPRDAAQAQYHLGELARTRAAAIRIDPSRDGAAPLARALEEKGALVRAARDRYLAAIRLGDPDWAIAAGSRIGDLYEALHAELLGAPLPPGLDAPRAEAYRAALREEIAGLADAAIAAYEQTLAAAQRAGLDDAELRAHAEAALARLRRIAAEGAEPPAARGE